ncbi:MAG TPA: translocation/assembly module TamB domain-containing protein [Polyangiaceae bacterium]|nr:translocation/assembly module TamB domain-containing protein [Polyangiaceae bacterium]
MELLAKASGTLPDLTFEARLLSRAGRVHAKGSARLGPVTRARVQVQARNIDVAALEPTLPDSDIDFELSAQAALSGDELDGTFRLLLPPTKLKGQTLPAVASDGRIRHNERSGLRVSGQAEIDEAGAPTTVQYELALGSRPWLEARSQTWLSRPQRLVTLAGVSLAGVVEARVRYDLASERIDGNLQAALPRVVRGRESIEQLRIQATAKGPASAPELALSADAEGLVALDRYFERARVRVAKLELSPVLALKNCDVALTRNSTTLQGHVAELSLGKELRVEGLALDTAGSAWVSLTWRNGLERLQARAQDVDLPRVARALGLVIPIAQGKLSLEANIDRTQEQPSGLVRATLRELDVGSIDEGRIDLTLAVRDGQVDGALMADLVRGGRLALTLEDVPLLEPPFDAKALERLTGRIGIDGELDLAALDRLLVNEKLPFERASGRITVDAALERPAAGDKLPELVARVQTRRLELVGKRTPVGPEHSTREALSAAPMQLRPLDVDAELRLDSASGKTALRVKAKDDRGELFHLEGRTELPKALSSALQQSLMDLPIEAKLVVPPKKLDEIPGVVALSGSEGRAGAELVLRGTPRDPELSLMGRVIGLRPLAARSPPLDLQVHAEIEREGGRVAAEALVGKQRVASLRGSWQGDVTSLGEATFEQSPVQGSASLDLRDFPLAAIPGSSLRQLRGAITGHLELEDFGRDARVNGYLQARPLRFGEARFKEVLTTISMGGDSLKANVRLEQAHGSAQGALAARFAWGASPVPTIDAPVDARFAAKALRLTGFALLAPGVIDEIDGQIDADVEGRFGDDEPFLRGSLSLHDGVLQEPITAQHFHDIDARVTFAPGEVRVEELVARGSSGRLRATATARLQGMSLREAQAHVRIKQSEKIPVTVEGVAYGDAWGKVDAAVNVDEQKGTNVNVAFTELTLELPESAGTEPQPLEAAQYVRIGTHQRNGELVTLPLQPMAEAKSERRGPPTVVTVKVTPKARLRKGSMFDVQFGGETRIELADELTMSGQITISAGQFDLQGKIFDIERGVVSFDSGEPSNPTVLATARWDSPADYTVTVEYAGTVKQGQLTLSADPPLTQNEIMSLLMFGNPEGTSGSSSGSAAAAAFGVAGSTAIRGVNRVINRLTKLDLDARVDTSTGSARPELVLQLTPRLSARVTRSLGEPAPGQPPDRTFATLDMRLGGRWSLATTVGDRGASAVDLIWRHRY